MSKFSPTRTSHGNYKCPYCTHKIWKTEQSAERHVETTHADEASKAWAEREISRLERLVVDRNNTIAALRMPEKPKEEFYKAIWYCANCLKLHSGGLPQGVSVSNVVCGRCGVMAIHLVTNVDKFWVK